MGQTLRTMAMAGVLAAVLAAGCKGPRVPHPLTGQSRFTCCNMHFEHPDLSDANYQVGTLIPFGTRVEIREVGRNSVVFQAAGQPPLTLVLKYGKDAMSFDQFLERTFVADDPHGRLRKVPAARQKLIAEGVVEKGMPRDQVLMALGFPPAHRTPSLDSPQWHYWKNRWIQFDVFFDGDRVSRVQD